MGRVVFVSQSAGAADGGGIDTHLTAKVRLLAGAHELTLIACDASRPELERRFAQLPAVRIVTIPEFARGDNANHLSAEHRWSADAWRRIRELFAPGPGPDLIEFSDYLGAAAVTVQAKRTGEPLLRDTRIAVAIATTKEICDVLNGSLADDFDTRVLFDLERYALRFADLLLHTRGDVRGMYERFYGAEHLAPLHELPRACMPAPPSAPPPPRTDDDPLRVLYLGRIERRKGIADLVDALACSPLEGWSLTVAGADTMSGTLGSSLRNVIEQAARLDPRIELRDEVPRDEVAALIAAHDALISPSLWECGPNVAYEALACNRPLLLTPVGGQDGLAEDCALTAGGTGVGELHDLMREAVERRAELRAWIREQRPARRHRELAGPAELRAAYAALTRGDAGADAAGAVGRDRSESARPADPPLVSVVIPYHGLPDYIEETVMSACAQTHPRVEVLIVNDGSFAEADAILDELARLYPVRVLHTVNRNVGAARNFGIRQSFGEFVLPLDADNTLEPKFAERALAALQVDPALAYATSWLRCIDAAGRPLEDPAGAYPVSNWLGVNDRYNAAGDAVALVRRSVFERAGLWYDELFVRLEDWGFYRKLAARGMYGHAIPETLFRYRVREGSKLRTDVPKNSDQQLAALSAAVRAEGVRWTTA